MTESYSSAYSYAQALAPRVICYRQHRKTDKGLWLVYDPVNPPAMMLHEYKYTRELMTIPHELPVFLSPEGLEVFISYLKSRAEAQEVEITRR